MAYMHLDPALPLPLLLGMEMDAMGRQGRLGHQPLVPPNKRRTAAHSPSTLDRRRIRRETSEGERSRRISRKSFIFVTMSNYKHFICANDPAQVVHGDIYRECV